jgi:hypothetical protein
MGARLKRRDDTRPRVRPCEDGRGADLLLGGGVALPENRHQVLAIGEFGGHGGIEHPQAMGAEELKQAAQSELDRRAPTLLKIVQHPRHQRLTRAREGGGRVEEILLHVDDELRSFPRIHLQRRRNCSSVNPRGLTLSVSTYGMV